MPDPGPLGWVAPLLRWSAGDVHQGGLQGPLPPPRQRASDTADRELYQGLADGWLHGTVGAALSSFFSEPRTRKELYVLFEKMDMTDLAGSFLDLISEDATERDSETKRRIWSTGPDAIVAANLALFERLKTEEELPAHSRDLAKFGDDFGRLVYRSGIEGGIRRMIPLPPINITRKENKEGTLLGYMQQGKRFKNDNSEVSYPWDFAHFRIRGRDRRYPYGTSLLHNAIRPWKQLIVMEEWMLGYQLAKHPDRNLVMLDIGSASDAEGMAVAKQFKQKLVKHLMVDPAGTTGQNMGQRYDAHTGLQDLVLPIRSGSATDVKKLAGSQNATDIAPLMMTVQKFFSAVRAPKEFFGYGDGVMMQNMNPKATLTNQDVRYARQVRRLQDCMKSGYRYMCELNLMLMMSPSSDVNGPSPADLAKVLDFRMEGNEFELHMAPISFLGELERLEVEQTRQQVALGMLEMGLNNPAVDIIGWTDYIFREVMKVPEDKMEEVLRQDLEMEHIDNMALGLMPDGTPVPQPPVSESARSHKERMKAVSEALRKMPRSHRTALADRKLKDDEKTALSEAIKRNPKLRELITLGRALFDPSAPMPHGGVLPDNELMREGKLDDRLTEVEVEQMLDEAKREIGVSDDDGG